MKSMYVLLLLSIFTANIAIGVAGNGSHNGAIMAGRSTVGVATNERPLQQQLYPQRPRRQQQTLNYRANYTADFQHLVSPTCTGDAPVLEITCYGQNMEISSVSHPSIDCRKQVAPLVENGTSYECTVSCVEDGICAEAYRTNDIVANAFESGAYGSILFMCEGNTLQDVKAEYILRGRTNTGSCIADSTVTTRNNLRVARLGLLCPSSGAFYGSDLYVFNDTYFECRSNTSSGDTASSPNDAYICFNGQQCGGQGCNVTFLPIRVLTHVPSFVKDCVQRLVPIDGLSNTARQAETSLYSVRFEALWITLNPDYSSCTTTSDANHAIQIVCDSNVGSTIVYVSSTDTTVNCINKKENVLECTGDPTQSINRFTTVVYDCFSSNIPSSTVTYPDSIAYCENNVNEANISNYVSLGIMCGDEIVSFDQYLECSDSHHNFVIEDGLINLPVGSRYFCSESTVIARNSLASNMQNIRNVSITTEEYWQSNAGASCYQQFNANTSRPPVMITVPFPTFAPNQATEQIERPPTGVAAPPSPTNALSPVPSNPTSDILTSPSKGDLKNDKVFIIAVVGGVAGGILIFVLWSMVCNKGKNDAVDQHKVKAFPPAQDQNDTDNNTESHHSPNMQQSSNHTNAGSPAIVSVAALASLVETTPSDFYEVQYKDQSRSVIGTVWGRTQPGRSSNNDKSPLVPVQAQYYKTENEDNPNPTYGIEIPTVAAIMCTDTSMLDEEGSSIHPFADSNSSLRMPGQSNHSFGTTRAWNSSIRTESDTDKIHSEARKEHPPSALLADANSSFQMVGEFNRSFHLLDDANNGSTIPAESNTFSNDYNKKKPALADPNSSFRMVEESNRSFHTLEDSNTTITTQSNTNK